MRKLWIASALSCAAVVLAALPVSAKGGWAITSLDAVPAARAGEEVQVGFTIRQHGVSPVNPDEDGNPAVAVVVRASDGEESRFVARQDGPTGHYVAEVTFPDAGTLDWAVEQGWFGLYELGAIDVGPTTGAAPVASPDPSPEPNPLRVLLPLLAVAGIGLLLFDLRARRSAARQLAPG